MPHLRQPLVSTFLDTPAEGVPDEQPRYLNAALVGERSSLPATLLERLLDIEEQLGRTRPYWGAPRTLDLDLILYGDVQLTSRGLTCRTRASASGGSCWSRSRRWRRAGRPGDGKTSPSSADLG